MLEEWDQRGADTHYLMRGNVHVIHRFRCREDKTGVVTAGYPVAYEFLIVGQRRICLRDHIFILCISREIIELIRDMGNDADGIASLGDPLHHLRVDGFTTLEKNFAALWICHILT
jgi:hypothetical protein